MIYLSPPPRAFDVTPMVSFKRCQPQKGIWHLRSIRDRTNLVTWVESFMIILYNAVKENGKFVVKLVTNIMYCLNSACLYCERTEVLQTNETRKFYIFVFFSKIIDFKKRKSSTQHLCVIKRTNKFGTLKKCAVN